MTLLLNCQNISKSFGLVPVFKKISLSIQERDRIGIIGPNGAGKSTLLKILVGAEHADEGIVAPRRGLRVGYVPQHKDYGPGISVLEVMEQALAGSGQIAEGHRIPSVLGKAGFDPSSQASSLSGGWKKRLAICEELARSPELLLLDEPTNHLDLDGIEWLEEQLSDSNSPMAVCVISHDRYFLEAIATRIIEVNRVFPSGIFSNAGGYGEFMEHKAIYLEGLNATLASMANKLRMETAWLRRGAQARTTKQQARIKSATQLKADLEATEQRAKRQAVEFSFSTSERQTKRLIDAVELSKNFGDKELFSKLSFTLSPKMRLGLLGANGSGKSTLIKILQHQLPSDTGHVTHADKLRVVYYDQQREQLPNQLTLRRALSPDSDSVLFQNRSLHVTSYAKNFGFRNEQLDTTVDRLSGGERARLLLARMLLTPADVLILDEPTNDLDIDTLEVLEESLLSFPGAVILVTHDRYLIDRVCNGMLGLMGHGQHLFFADYSQYAVAYKLRQAESVQKKKLQKLDSPPAETNVRSTKKLSYKDQREWDGMEEAILSAEAKLAEAQAVVNLPDVQLSSLKLQEACKLVELNQAEVDRLYARWSELSAKMDGPH